MRKNSIRRLVLLHCLLLIWASTTFAAETPPPDDAGITLNEVVVNSLPLEKYLVTTSVITDKDIEKMGAQSLTQVLDSVPGLNLHRGRKNAETIDIRGSQLSYTKIYIDGVFVNPFAKVSKSAVVNLNMFPVNSIAKIEIVKGPAPVSYGTDAIGGIILITTKNGKDHPGGEVSLSGGSDNTRNAFVSYGGGDNKFNYFISAGTLHNDGYDLEPNATMKSNFVNTKLNWRFKDNSSLTLIGAYSLTDSGASLQMYDHSGNPISSTSGFWPGLNKWQYRDWEKSEIALDYTKRINEKLDFDIKAYHYGESQGLWADGRTYDPHAVTPNADHIAGPLNGFGFDVTRWNHSAWDTFLNGWEIQSNWKINSVHTLTFGTMYNNIGWKESAAFFPKTDPCDWRPGTFYWSSTSSRRFDYYLQDNFTPNEKTTITLGIRHDKNEYTNASHWTRTVTSTDPTVNVVYQADERNIWRASYGETCGFPVLSQLFGSAGPNPDLKPEKAKNYEIGFKHQFDENTTGDIAIFKNDIADLITKDPVNNQRSINLNWAEIKGVELNLDKRFSPRWRGFFNYTLLDTAAVYQTTSNPPTTYVKQLTYTPRNRINYGLDYKGGKGYIFSLTGHWVLSDRYTDDRGTGDTRTDKTPISYISGYHTMDLQVKRQINDKQDWYVKVYNLFDKQYEDELFYPAMGRTVIVGADFKF